MWAWIVVCLPVLALQQIGNLSKVILIHLLCNPDKIYSTQKDKFLWMYCSFSSGSLISRLGLEASPAARCAWRCGAEENDGKEKLHAAWKHGFPVKRGKRIPLTFVREHMCVEWGTGIVDLRRCRCCGGLLCVRRTQASVQACGLHSL